MLELQNLNYKIKDKQILQNINLKFEYGIYGLSGINGSGKSTLLKILSTIVKPTSGKSFYKQKEFNEKSLFYKQKISYLPQSPNLFLDLNVAENIIYFGLLKGVKKKDIEKNMLNLLQYFDIEQLQKTKVQNLSGGQKQKVSIIISLVSVSEILILDEPTNNLDQIERERLYEILSQMKHNTIILMASHITEELLNICDHHILIEKGVANITKNVNINGKL